MNRQTALDIIEETIKVFSTTEVQRTKYNSLDKLSNDLYKEIHPQFLTPLNIKIDSNSFINEIQQYDNEFVQWGKRYSDLPRLGLALVNTDGKLKGNQDPINGSLYEYNQNNPDNPVFESDCTIHTEVMNLPSLSPLKVLHGYFYRSNIFKWDDTAKFVPHIDAVLPTPWIRLWGTTNPENVTVNYYNMDTDTYETVRDIEPGRLYTIDTSLVHDANSTALNYQFFLSVNIHCIEYLRFLKLL